MVNKNFTRKNLSNKIYKELGYPKNLSSKLVDSFFEIIVNKLCESSIVKVTNFGTFKVLDKKKRIGRNPKTKVEFVISKRKVVKFIPAISFKKKINNHEK
jgi:integration host factor subunit alpha